MRRFLRVLFLLSANLGFVAVAPAADVGSADVAAPTEITASEAKQVRAVIESQLKALAKDDAKAAFAFAAPNIREMFGTPENFIEMVRAGYPVVYHPASIAFLKPLRGDGGIDQGVHLTDADGTLWLAVYHLERQRDKTWRISGCEVALAEGRVA